MGSGTVGDGDPPDRKRALRAEVLRRRGLRSAEQRETDGALLAAHVLALPEVRAASTVAAYASVGGEPPTRHLVEALAGRGVLVLLPVVQPDLDLDWAPYDGPRSMARGARGLVEPSGARLGPDAVATVDVVVVPALAADRAGRRLGRGGGSYDRALARVRAGTLTLALVYDGELVAAVPVEPHDRSVQVVVTPSGPVRGTR